MKRFVSFILVLVFLFCFAGSAMAIQGVADAKTYVNMRKSASLTAGVRAYIKGGTPVDIFDGGETHCDDPKDKDDPTKLFYRIGASSYTDRHNWTGESYRSGFGSIQYISY